MPFPFDDLSAAKVRPAVCLTEPIGNHNHIILAFITSQVITKPLESDLVIDPNDPGFAATGLRVASTLQLHRLMLRELGELTFSMQDEVKMRLRNLFALN